MNEDIKNKISSLIKNNKVFLFMKGTPERPFCGFSAQVVQILQHLNVGFESFNVFDDTDIREGIKEYTNWPTIPQLYVNEEFIGGCDIITELFENKELEKILNV